MKKFITAAFAAIMLATCQPPSAYAISAGQTAHALRPVCHSRVMLGQEVPFTEYRYRMENTSYYTRKMYVKAEIFSLETRIDYDDEGNAYTYFVWVKTSSEAYVENLKPGDTFQHSLWVGRSDRARIQVTWGNGELLLQKRHRVNICF